MTLHCCKRPTDSARSVSRRLRDAALLAGLLLARSALAIDSPPAIGAIQLEVNFTDAARQRFLVHEVIPVVPGHLRLVYPKWIPGEHGPTGPLNGITGLQFSAAGVQLAWRRDTAEMYAIELEVPAGTETLDLRFQYLAAGDGGFGAGGSTTPVLAELEWNQVLLYPEGAPASAITFVPTILLPTDWQFATALQTEVALDHRVRFAQLSLEQLVDSPVFAGRHARTFDLAPGAAHPIRLNVFGDRMDNLELKPEQLTHARNLPAQALKLTGASHYRQYDFLFGLSDHTATFGLEHHESSDDRLKADYYTDPDHYLAGAILLPHEYFHSWNGKFRRPRGLATADYQQPMRGDLLWVYEGMTNYYGEVLAARCGMWSAEQFRDQMAITAAAMQYTTGRQWRPLQDTADAAQLLYEAPRAYESWRRSVDYYPEGSLLWLDIDTELRTLSHGSRSLDDFVRAFHGIHPDAVEVLPYDFDEVVATLQKVQPGEWRTRLTRLLQSRSADAPLDGLRRAGWTLTFSATPSALFKAYEKVGKRQLQMYDLGLVISNDPAHGKGSVLDVRWESPAFAAGVAPGMEITAVNDQEYDADTLRRAIEAARSGTPLRLLVHSAGTYQTLSIDYRGGLRFPHLEAVQGQEDLLSQIAAPLP
jgi:predicted metalloprotease with PDZ domain